jgi:glutamate-ammonia-ligase adenylyltransferase
MPHGLPFVPKTSKLSSKEALQKLPDAIDHLLPKTQHDAAAALYALSGAFAPYLARLINRYPDIFAHAVRAQHDACLQTLIASLCTRTELQSEASWMRHARQVKEQVALIIALADLAKSWSLEKTTQALSDFADQVVQSALHFILSQAAKSDQWSKQEAATHHASGITILGMGKLGAHELNYSSDIDLIILFDPEKAAYTGKRDIQTFMNKLVQQLMHMLQHRTEHGYVLRTDIRLRPDPISMPPAISLHAATHYYETVGQNWERAAMIKARHIAGDGETGARFLQEMTPYIWRKNLDFNMIADINSIIRQMHSTKTLPDHLLGHNIKTGIAGIRYIEFLAQTQQLVWGGRNPNLRLKGTCEALTALKDAKLIDDESCKTLIHAYRYLRILEHRLQMLEDEQTHSLPSSEAGMAQIAHFMGFTTKAEFEAKTKHILQQVQRIYQRAMADSPPLATSGNLVFTGVGTDEGTLETLHDMGYTETVRISAIIQGWHRGNRRSTRSRRARQLLTELIPTILQKLGETADPDSAIFQFDEFLNRLPSSIQIFSLIQARPEILSFISHILGSAKALGRTLSNNPLLLDAMMEPEFSMPLAGKAALKEELNARLSHCKDYEQEMLLIRVFHNEKRFQAGTHMLKHLAPAQVSSQFLTDLAEIELSYILHATLSAYLQDHKLPNIPIAVLGFGRLGARDLTFNSDLDLVILYDEHAINASDETDLRKHIHRIGQRFIHALTSMTREGRLYEIDTRLRPGGNDGPLANSLIAFDRYFKTQAWTFEYMALTKARVIAHNSDDFAQQVQKNIRTHMMQKRDADTTHADIITMRKRITAEYYTANPWDIKYVSGGLIDVEFLAQYLVLRYARENPIIYQHDAVCIFTQASAQSVISSNSASALIDAYQVLSSCLSYQRLCMPGGIIANNGAPGLFTIMAQALHLRDKEALTNRLLEAEATVRHYVALFTQTQTF